jgi:hypothetical protein
MDSNNRSRLRLDGLSRWVCSSRTGRWSIQSDIASIRGSQLLDRSSWGRTSFHSVLFRRPFDRAAGPFLFRGLRAGCCLSFSAGRRVASYAPQLLIRGLSISKAPLSGACSGNTSSRRLFVPRGAPDLHIAGAALRAERPKARQLVATLQGRRCRSGLWRRAEGLLGGAGNALSCAMKVYFSRIRGRTYISGTHYLDILIMNQLGCRQERNL